MKALDPGRKVAVLSDGPRCPTPCSSASRCIACRRSSSNPGLAAHPHDWVPVNKQTLETRVSGCLRRGRRERRGHAQGGRLRRRVGAGRGGGDHRQLRGGPSPEAYKGQGSCYVEFGHDQVGRVDVDFLSGPKPTGTFQPPRAALVAEKALFGSSRLQRWFGRPRAAHVA